MKAVEKAAKEQRSNLSGGKAANGQRCYGSGAKAATGQRYNGSGGKPANEQRYSVHGSLSAARGFQEFSEPMLREYGVGAKGQRRSCIATGEVSL